MRTLALIGIVLASSFAGACSTTGGLASQMDNQMDGATRCTETLGYSSDQLRQIVVMREGGESLARISKVVGVSKDDIRRVDRAHRSRRRGEPAMQECQFPDPFDRVQLAAR